MQINLKQVIGIVIAILGVLMISTAQLTDLMGAGAAKTVTSVAALLNSILGSVMAVITSNTQTVKDASDTTGVEPIRINRDASKSLAAMAVDPSISNVGLAAHEYEDVEAKASGAVS